MLEWFSAHPVLTIFLVLLLTVRLWFVPVALMVVAAGVALWGLGLVALYAIACAWEWADLKIRRLRRRGR